MKADTWTITVKMTVFAGDMDKANVMGNAQQQLENMCDGSDFMSIFVEDAERDEV